METKISKFLFLFIKFSKMFIVFINVHEMALEVNEIKTSAVALK